MTNLRQFFVLTVAPYNFTSVDNDWLTIAVDTIPFKIPKVTNPIRIQATVKLLARMESGARSP